MKDKRCYNVLVLMMLEIPAGQSYVTGRPGFQHAQNKAQVVCEAAHSLSLDLISELRLPYLALFLTIFYNLSHFPSPPFRLLQISSTLHEKLDRLRECLPYFQATQQNSIIWQANSAKCRIGAAWREAHRQPQPWQNRQVAGHSGDI